MARRFVRVDLSPAARDFRPVALEPGVPMLDSANANGRIVFKWLKGLAAEPEWEGESVHFYARDDQGGRLEEQVCRPAGEEDLKGPLAADLEAIGQRLAEAKAENSTERLLLEVLRRGFRELVDDEHRPDRGNYFFCYRDVLGRLRLVWCWGYQRIDQQPAPTVVCADEDCNLLFVRRPGQSPKCPACEAALPTPTKKPKRRGVPAVWIVLLVLLAAGAAWWYLGRHRLRVVPGQWTGPAGSRIAFEVKRPGLFGWGERDVGDAAVAVADDPRVVRPDRFGSGAVAAGAGTSLVRFYYGRRRATVRVTVQPPGLPERITIEPALVELSPGTTARLALRGHYAGGATADLTDSAVWVARNDGIAFAYDGRVEGLAAGTTTVTARYPVRRPAQPPENDQAAGGRKQAADGTWYRIEYLEASANVSVADVPLESLELAVRPEPVPLGRAARLTIDAVAADGRRYSVLGSSRLDLRVEPSALASVRRGRLAGHRSGSGRLGATFDGRLSGELDFRVAPAPGVEALVVAPESLEMAVGEIADLSIASPRSAAVAVESSDPSVVEISPHQRLVGRAEGTARVTVRQGGQSRAVEVAVREADLRAIAVWPPQVAVPVDHAKPVPVHGETAGGRRIELAPDRLEVEAAPSPRYARLNAATLVIHGVNPTEASDPQQLALRLGNLKDAVPVEVLVAPLRLELTPPGPVDLPLGQMLALEAWANYGNGLRVQVLPDRLAWNRQPVELDPPGLELREHKVAALAAGAGPLQVSAGYFGNVSNRVAFRSVEPGPVDLRAMLERTLRLVGEPGQIELYGVGPRGDVELVPELAKFESSSSDVVDVDGTTGAFRAAAPGEATVTATHPASDGSAGVDLIVVEPSQARLVLEPDDLPLTVDQRRTVRLYLEGLHNDRVERAAMAGPGVSYSLERPEAVSWRPPLVVGKRPAAPFEMAAGYLPYLSRAATARIEVVAADPPAALRVVPGEAKLAPGQTLALSVEAQWSGSKQWKEVRPDAVAWEVPGELAWQPPGASLRPALTLPEQTGTTRLTARYGGREAVCRIDPVRPSLDASDPSVVLELVREPEGRYVPIGCRQRYGVVLRKGDQTEPAAEVRWPQDFENEYVGWRDGVLTAKQPGYRQWLSARVGGRTVRFDAVTIDPFQTSQPPPRRADQPVEVRVVSDQGPRVRFPIGAHFDDFRIEAEYADGFVRMVTKKATMRLADGSLRGPVAFADGQMIGLAAGTTSVEAEFDGVASTAGLGVTVTPQVEIDELRLAPAPLRLLPGESATLEAIGYQGGNSVGKLTGLGGMRWTSSNDQVARVSGPVVTGVGLGQSTVTAQYDKVASAAAVVDVVDSLDDALVVDQDTIEMYVGESRRIGVDLSVFRGDTDFSRLVEVTPALAGVVRYDPATHALVGVSPGVSPVTFAWGDKLAGVTVRVLPIGTVEGDVVIEPAGGVLSPGQALDLRVYLVTRDGLRLDRTSSAVLTSSSPATVAVRGNLACALQPGSAEVTAVLPEAKTAARSLLTVNSEPITALALDPSRLAMSTGDTARLRVLGRSASGTHALFPQPDLTLSAEGADPGAIRIVGAGQVDAIRPGAAKVAVGYRGLTGRVPVSVGDDPWTQLAVEPALATIHPGEAIVYQVTGLRGGRRRVVRPGAGLRLHATDPAVAHTVGANVVAGDQPGRTSIVAQVGGATAEAALHVVPGSRATTDPVVVSGPGRTTILGPGYQRYGTGYLFGDPGYVVERPGGLVVEGRPGGEVYLPPQGRGDHLRFVPDTLRLGVNSPPSAVRVLEVFEDGTVRDVTRDSGLEFSPTGDAVALEQTAQGPVLRPLKPGQVRLAARLGTRVTIPELLVQVGNLVTGSARLEVFPQPLELAPQEVGTFSVVRVDPGAGQTAWPVNYSVGVPPGQAVVRVEPDGRLRGLSPGVAEVVVTSVDPGGPFDRLTTVARVRVGSLELTLEPADVSIEVGQSTPPLVALAAEDGGVPYPVSAPLESVDPTVLVPGGDRRFIAQSLGSTQVRASYRGREAFATVSVTGKRFLHVATSLDSGTTDFSVTMEVLAADSEGPLEYRVYPRGSSPPRAWTASEEAGDQQRVELRSPRIPYGDRTARYNLILEARSRTDGSVQKYPFTFRLESKIVEETPRR